MMLLPFMTFRNDIIASIDINMLWIPMSRTLILSRVLLELLHIHIPIWMDLVVVPIAIAARRMRMCILITIRRRTWMLPARFHHRLVQVSVIRTLVMMINSVFNNEICFLEWTKQGIETTIKNNRIVQWEHKEQLILLKEWTTFGTIPRLRLWNHIVGW